MTSDEAAERRRIEHKIRAKAHKRVRAKLGLYWHFAMFALLNVAMIAINLTLTPNYRWFVWPLAAWSFAIVVHAFAIFQGAGMSEAMVEEEIAREFSRRGIN